MTVDWCAELDRLEAEEAICSCPGMPDNLPEVIRQLQPEPAWQTMLKQGLVLLAYQAVGGNPAHLVILTQRRNGKKSKPRK